MKEMKLDRQEFNLLVNDILLDVKPVKLRISIANRLIEFFDKKQERIAELEEQLKKKPKYNIGDRVYIINEDYEVERDFIESIDIDTDGIEYYTEMYSICFDDCQLFKTKEEAEAKLKELKGKVKNYE